MKLKSKVMLMLALTGMMVVGSVTAMAQETAQMTYKTVNARHEGPNKIVKENLKLTQKWDKTFKQSDKVDHQKVTFVNRYGITLAADMYTPKDAKGKLPALAVAGPFGAVKEQASGLYAQTMAEKGFVTLAFDPSFTGESGGTPRYIASSDINTEDFSAAVDFLSTQDNVDPDRVGLIGICGFGGFALNAAANDTRIKATVASTMYDMSRVAANGYFDYEKDADTLQKERMATRKAISDQRTIDYKNGYYKRVGGVPDNLPADAPWFVKDYYNYYKTTRGYHPVRSTPTAAGTSRRLWASFPTRFCRTSAKYRVPSWSSTAKRPIPATSVKTPSNASKGIIRNSSSCPVRPTRTSMIRPIRFPSTRWPISSILI